METQLTAVGLSPLLAAVVVTAAMLVGLDTESAARAASLVFAGLAVASLSPAASRSEVSTAAPPSEAGGIAGRTWLIAAVAVALLAVFPLLGEASRMKSDAWFHSAVVSEINAFGLPPTDPYFSGMGLQYMWLYHVYVAALSKATGLDASWTMAIVNLQALAALVIATSALARTLGGTKGGSLLSSVFVLVGMNCLFWAFLPIKVAKAAVGEIRGWQEITQQFSIFPLDAETMRAFVSVARSQPFLLDKFIVATAFSLGLALSVAFFLFLYRYIALSGRSDAVAASLALAGAVLFHTPAGVAAAGTAGIALVALALTSRSHRRRAVAYILWMMAVGALSAPYILSVAGAKESEQLVPFSVSPLKTAAVLISCAAAILLGAPWVARFLKERGQPRYFYGLLAAAALIVALCIDLPGPNKYDKPPYFAYLPLAPLAGWSLVSICRRGATVGRRALLSVFCAVAIAPNAALLYAAYVADPAPEGLLPERTGLYEWIRENTPREAVFLENKDRVKLVVLGPRRLIWGQESYADQWGYDRDEMERRKELRDRVYSKPGLTADEARELAGFGDHVYVVVRHEDFTPEEFTSFESSPYLSPRYSGEKADVYRVTPQGSQ